MNETIIIAVYCFAGEFIWTIMNHPAGRMSMGRWEGKRGKTKENACPKNG
jgi:hypothetical protein